MKTGLTSFSPTEETADLARVLQELDTYWVELELQNEELKNATQELQQAKEALEPRKIS